MQTEGLAGGSSTDGLEMGMVSKSHHGSSLNSLCHQLTMRPLELSLSLPCFAASTVLSTSLATQEAALHPVKGPGQMEDSVLQPVPF